MLLGDKITHVLDDKEAIKQEMARLDETLSDNGNRGSTGSLSGVAEELFDADDDLEMPAAGLTEPNDSQAICSLAMQSFQESLTTTDWGETLFAKFNKDARTLAEMTKKVPQFMP